MSKGGMCQNPFAGYPRPDKFELQSFLGPHDPPEKALILATIRDAFENYAYFGLGDEAPDGSPRGNGTTAENFYHDFLYFFVVRSYLPETWENARVMRDTYIDEVTGKRQTRYLTLTDEQLKLMCFDTHFGLLDWPFSMDRLLQRIRDHRMNVLAVAKEQIQTYVRLMRETSVKNYAPGHSLPLFMDASDQDMRILLEPRSADEVEDMVGYVPKYFKAKKARERRVPVFKAAVLAATRRLTLAAISQEGPTLLDAVEASVSGVSDDPGRRGARVAA